MRVLLTGAFGNVGTSVRLELAKRGYQVDCFDLPTWANRLAAGRKRAKVTWGDIRRADAIAAAMTGQDAVIHLAAVIPPRSELHPVHAYEVNVVGTGNLLAALRAQSTPPRLIHVSTATLFGPTQHLPPPRTVHDPVTPTDHYTKQKAVAEQLVREWAGEWTILRLGAVVPFTIASRNPRVALDATLQVPLAQRMEVVHRRDVAVALTHALSSDEVGGRTFLIGGGPSCQVRQREVVAEPLAAWGIDMPADEAFSTEPYYLDWLDTTESERVLRYQRHSFADCCAEMRAAAARWRPAVRLANPLIRQLIAARSTRLRAGRE